MLGQKQVVKATEIRKGDFLEGDFGVSTAEVIDVRVQPEVVLVDLAVKGVVRLDPSWDVAVFRQGDTGGNVAQTGTKRGHWTWDAWCKTCGRDTAFCLCTGRDYCNGNLVDCGHG